MSVEIAWKQNILVTDSYLLKLLLVVFGFGLQAFICDFSRQNICSVPYVRNTLLNIQTRITMSEEVLVAEKIFEEEVIIEETKGQIKPKAGWANCRFSKKTNKRICLFAMKSKKANKTNLFVRFLRESTARQSAFGFI